MATLEIDDALLEEATTLLRAKNPKMLIEEELRASVRRRKAQLELLDLGGTVEWEGDLDAMRRDK
ncbi:antitoxin of type II TA system, VapB [Fulvimarina manganoxydans]|uniref:Antitoxin of type II TA system, VapB n=1 Tax=Fulvimarina manganoxydans TaxID=937218 RepID=A0A1W1ZRZ7_9HYPH|nr:type II toxin-antitoxin system VapB family antitoxin [Fulvimarina manganoxydans]SMC51073.1 antitoxin of type II TA system, VapB [Fulvimarina manganoxydans]